MFVLCSLFSFAAIAGAVAAMVDVVDVAYSITVAVVAVFRVRPTNQQLNKQSRRKP